ncbi:RRP12-like protein isoform 2 [Homo sapiens]|uniref:Isoform 3 of RRP12-like protein n=1 Tax=Homo sapiens TaxID=9606 RepID=Q5JTH9-3|nr:RRP12-like protein isoform 2 [Homo sapiens]KAI2556823.1 ribosomal RNA processing 12-like protein [Homo sapiens]|eukprot:NP_001138586.1 RRP12-like protein isoform 2 [Homo sapiens]
MGRSGKLPSGVSAKLKRWKKGHSSDSNPAICRHRQAARSRFFSRPSGRSDLTVDAVKLHNELQSGSLRLGKSEAPETPMEEEAELVLTEKSSGTFLSGLSDCTNVTFSKVQRFWESNSAAHKEICAVLAAVTEVIRSQGGKETETEYFAALVLSCLATLLRKQDLEAWGYPVTLQVYHGLLSFTVHPKPKIRKAAQHGVCSVLKGSEFMFEKAPAHHPAAISTAKFCIQEIEKSGGSKEATTTLHMLTLLKDLLPCFPEGLVKSCSETLLRVMTLSHVLVTACAMQAFHSLFHARPGLSTLSAELNAQIITALYDYVPSENDLQPLLAWLKVMEKAHINLVRLQWDLGLGHLPRFFGTAVTCLLSPHSQVLTAATQSLKEILKECVAPHMADIGSVTSSASGPAQSVAKMFRAVEEGLTYKFHAAWSSVLQLLCVFFEACGRQAHPVMRKCLQSLCDLRLSPHFPHTAALDQAVGAAVTSMGPEVVLQAVPLEIDGSEETLDFPRSWLLPVIRDHVQETRLGFFTTYFLPLANTLKSKAMDLAQAGSTVESKIYDTLQWQMWTLLPGFCTRPTDVAISFKGLARTLGMAISERPDLRVTVCQALRTLITKGCQAEADRAEVSRFAKNFLPILFNLYGQPVAAGDTPAPRRAVLETIRTYLTITDTQLVNSLLEKASEKVLDPASSDFTRLSVLDLVVALAPCADEAAISKLYSTIRPYLESKAHGVQKKAYRVLEEVCASPQGPGALFVQSHLEDLKKTLLDSLRSTSSPAKRPRLKCLLHIVRKLSAEHKEFITALIPEVILCTKEVSVGARKNAFALLVEMGHAFLRFGSNQEEALQCYLVLIYPGLVGAVTMVSCSILALTHLLFEFKGLMGTSTVEQLLENVCLLLASRTRDVVKSALGFIKVAVTVMDVAHLAKHVQLVMEAIGKLSDDMRRHFRMKLRNLFTKFIRKFGFELVKRLLPEEYHRVLVNIRKAEARAKRHRALSQAAVEEEEEEEEEEEPAQGKGDSIEEILADSEDEEDNEEEERSRGKEQRKLARQRSRAWLKEGGGDEPLNFLDPKVAQRVLATQPGPGRGRKKDHGFKVSADGRLIIREEADGNKMEEEEGAKGEDEEMADPMEDVIIRNKKHQKLKHQKEAEEEELEIPPQYQAGGSGIHRPVAKKAMPGAEYKAKKAKGDVKKKGRPDPYAYIPLNRSKLNRRKKMKLQGQFKGLVKAARRGSQVGHKNRRKDRRP